MRPALEGDIKIDAVTGAWSFELAIRSRSPKLSAGESLVATYIVTVDDHVAAGTAAVLSLAPASLAASLLASDPVGSTTTQTITLTFTGVNDSPVIGTVGKQALAETPGVTGSTTPIVDTVHVAFVDPDPERDRPYRRKSRGHGERKHGGFALDNAALAHLLTAGPVVKTAGKHTGIADFTFSAADKTFDYLAEGQKLVLSYNVEVDDTHGGSGTQTINFGVTGADDAQSSRPATVRPPRPSISASRSTTAGTPPALRNDRHGEGRR